MKRVELLSVEDTFQIEGFGILVRPDFSLPKVKSLVKTETVLVVKPDGCEFEAVARFDITHLNIADPMAPIEARYRVVISFPDKNKNDLPIGSKIFVTEELRNALISGRAS